MWEILGLLRLVKPLPIHITGNIAITKEGFSGLETLWHRTHLNIAKQHGGDSLEHVLRDIQAAQTLHASPEHRYYFTEE